MSHASIVFTSNNPWKADDRDWFAQNPTRAHRVRLPFPGEADDVAAEGPPDHVFIVLVRQLEPGTRQRMFFYLHPALWPAPDDEAVAHALFEVAAQREATPPNGAALMALVEKYNAMHGGVQ